MKQSVRVHTEVLRERVWRQAARRKPPPRRAVRLKALPGPAALTGAGRWAECDERTPPCGHCTQSRCSGTDCPVWRRWWGYHFRRLCGALKSGGRRGNGHV